MMHKKVMLVTGASRGIGAATAYEAAMAGYYVVINYNSSEEQARTLAEKIINDGGECKAVKADISNADAASFLCAEALKYSGKIDVLVNNAGISSFSLFTDITDELWKKTFDVNVNGNFYVTRNVVPHMVREKNGKIINISSVWGICGSSCEVHYSATKAAIIGMTKALAKELGPSHITVNCIAPGVVDTEMNSVLSKEDMQALCEETPLERIGKPSEIAKSVLFLASEDADFITGQVLSPNGGFVI